jgi:hypothetical protein
MTRQMHENLIRRGFDLTDHTRSRFARPRCSQCEVLVINGVACHETGCPHQTHECKGCDAIINNRHQMYCEDCQ